jgi:GNAT superfamily N-acetyltransferase
MRGGKTAGVDSAQGVHRVSDDRGELDLDVVHGFLARSYEAAGIPREVVARSIEHSLCFGLFEEHRQVGFARCVTDRATFSYLADVFVLESTRGRGLGSFLLCCVHAHPRLQGVRRRMFVTRDAHELYRKHGWTPLAASERTMEIVVPDPYGRGGSAARDPGA